MSNRFLTNEPAADTEDREATAPKIQQIRALQELGPKMAKRYGHIGNAAHRQAVSALDPVMKGAQDVGTNRAQSPPNRKRESCK